MLSMLTAGDSVFCRRGKPGRTTIKKYQVVRVTLEKATLREKDNPFSRAVAVKIRKIWTGEPPKHLAGNHFYIVEKAP